MYSIHGSGNPSTVLPNTIEILPYYDVAALISRKASVFIPRSKPSTETIPYATIDPYGGSTIDGDDDDNPSALAVSPWLPLAVVPAKNENKVPANTGPHAFATDPPSEAMPLRVAR